MSMFSRRALIRSLLLILVVITASSIGAAADQQTEALAKPPPPPVFSHVVIVMEENHGFSQVVGATNMPYFNALIAGYGLASNYYANAHPSIPNYFILTTGRMISKNDAFSKVVKVNNVVRIFKANKITWKAYVENLPSDPTRDSWPYLRRHNPFSYFSDVLKNPDEQANLVDFSDLASDIALNSLPKYSFIVPNAYHSAHGDIDNTGGLCANPMDELAEADCWLQTEIDPLVRYLVINNGLLLIVWDEGDGADKKHGGGHTATVIVSNSSIPGFQSTTFFQHQSTLRLTLQALGLTRFPGAAARAPQMGAFFSP